MAISAAAPQQVLESPVIFSVTGDVPYGSSEVSVFQDQIDDHNTFSPSSFIVHVGDILAGDESCNESRYITVADILKTSQVPAFIIPGDNETTDCSSPSQGWSYWEKHLSRIEENFCGTPNVQRQSSQDENFAFVLDGVLFIGIHLVGGSNSSSILQRDADWVDQQFSDHVSSVRGAVIFSQAGPGGNSLFFNAFETSAGNFAKPILFIHGDGHSWKKDHPFSESNVLRVQIDRGNKPPVQVTASLDVNDMFQFDRDPFSGATPISRGPCGEPPASWVLTSQVQGSGSISLNPSGGTYTDGTSVTLQALSDPGWTFQNWSGDLSGGTNPRSLTMDANKSVTAVFVQLASNEPPVTLADQYETNEDEALVIASPGILANDEDPDGDPLSASVAQLPSHGSLQLSSQGGFTYTPDPDWNGNDAFLVDVDDGQGGVTRENVDLTVYAMPDAPQGVDDVYSVGENTMLQLAAPGVLLNDNDPDGDPMQSFVASLPTSGILQLGSDGALQYIPDGDFLGTDSFSYVVSDGTSQSPQVNVTLQVQTPITGNVTLTPQADAFVLSTTPSTNYGSDTQLTVEQDVTVHHTYLRFDVPGGTVPLGATLRLYVTNPSNDGGTLVAVSNNYKDQSSLWEESGITWDNAPDLSGAALASVGSVTSGTWVELDVSDAVTTTGLHSFGLYSNSTNSVRYNSRQGSYPPELVLATNPNTSPTASNDAYSISGDGALAVQTPGVLGNDDDADADPLQALLVVPPSHGAVTLQSDGSFVYEPDAGFQGVDSFRYVACDPSNGTALAWCNLHVRRPQPQRNNDALDTDVLANSVVRWTLPASKAAGLAGVPLSVSIESPASQQVMLDVFDVSGRRVRHIVQNLSATASTQLVWNGRSERGLRVAAGVYFARVHLGSESATRRVVILR